jgi:hypothetical protein
MVNWTEDVKPHLDYDTSLALIITSPKAQSGFRVDGLGSIWLSLT